ncbi:MAG: GNVR domain-containing protein [Desulfobacteraceae bacterium]|jgi:polysaccharide chain length determinant protein (PEP-CTERM system associated)
MEKNEASFKLTPEFILEMIIRRRWLILIPIFISMLIGIALVILLPKVYEAKTLILIEGQRVPQSYVQSIITEDPAQRIATISQQILSTTNLENIIKDFNLFEGPKAKDLYLEDKVKNLRERISVDVIGNRRETEAFTITYRGKEPRKVMLVANGLASYFIEENLKSRESQAIGTSQFLDSELESMRTRLEQVEEAIKNYRKSNMGELPEQLETNLRILERLQANLTNKQQQLRETKIRLSDLQSQTTRNTTPIIVIEGAGRTNQPTRASLEDLQAELHSLESRYTDKHPDIQRLKNRIEEMKVKLAKSAGDTSGTENVSVPPQLRSQINEAKRDITVAEAELKDLKDEIAGYQKRIEETPKREQELLSLRRDYQNIKASYESLLNRKLEADIAVNMERKQKGEQFRVIDPARLPERPVEPDMRKLFIIIFVLGIGIGGGAAFLLEYMNTAFRNPADIESFYDIPVLTSIPFLMTPKHMMMRKINNAASIVFSGVVFVLIMFFGLVTLKGPELIGTIIK